MTDTRTVPPAILPMLRFRLPGEWWQIPLHDRVEARESVRRLVQRRVGAGDRLATVRADFRRELFGLVDGAIDGHGQSMHIALNVVQDLPLSASFTVFLPEVGMTPAVGTDPRGVLRVLEEGLRQAGTDDWETIERFEVGESAVVRVHRQRLVPTGGSEPDRSALSVDYWMTIPGTKRVVLIAFSTAFAELEEVMLTFFDSIVRVTWWERSSID
jgi:hypothetical protein